MTSFTNNTDLSTSTKSALFSQLSLLGSSLLRNFLEGCVASCTMWMDAGSSEFRWEVTLSNACGPLRAVPGSESSSNLASLTNFTFASVVAQMMSGLARDGNTVVVSRYSSNGFTLSIGDEGLTLSISYEPVKDAPGGVSFFALTMDGSNFSKPFERVLRPITGEGIHDAVEATLVELRSYLTTKRIRGISASKRYGA